MVSTEHSYIRFDWAMKRMLRDKVNYAVLEGLLTTLLGRKITIKKLLESESNQEEEYDKCNRVDILAEDADGRLILVEVQNNSEYACFQRMLFGAASPGRKAPPGVFHGFYTLKNSRIFALRF